MGRIGGLFVLVWFDRIICYDFKIRLCVFVFEVALIEDSRGSGDRVFFIIWELFWFEYGGRLRWVVNTYFLVFLVVYFVLDLYYLKFLLNVI